MDELVQYAHNQRLTHSGCSDDDCQVKSLANGVLDLAGHLESQLNVCEELSMELAAYKSAWRDLRERFQKTRDDMFLPTVTDTDRAWIQTINQQLRVVAAKHHIPVDDGH